MLRGDKEAGDHFHVHERQNNRAQAFTGQVVG
jgi:hypothetical protein